MSVYQCGSPLVERLYRSFWSKIKIGKVKFSKKSSCLDVIALRKFGEKWKNRATEHVLGEYFQKKYVKSDNEAGEHGKQIIGGFFFQFQKKEEKIQREKYHVLEKVTKSREGIGCITDNAEKKKKRKKKI